VAFQPGLDGATLPYGTWWASSLLVTSPYYAGTDTSDPNSVGIVVNNDVALVWLLPNTQGKQISDVVGGWMGYGWNGFSFATPVATYRMPTAPATAMVKALGYPVAFDGGNRLQSSDASTYVMSSSVTNLKGVIKWVVCLLAWGGGGEVPTAGLLLCSGCWDRMRHSLVRDSASSHATLSG
jgi:hypothetical protein